MLRRLDPLWLARLGFSEIVFANKKFADIDRKHSAGEWLWWHRFQPEIFASLAVVGSLQGVMRVLEQHPLVTRHVLRLQISQ